MKLIKIPLALAALAIVGAGCGRDGGGDSDAAVAAPPATVAAPATTVAPPTTEAPATTAAPAPEAVAFFAAKSGQSELGRMLVGESGLTLYGFTNDVDAISTCYSTCADAWPPVIVDAEWTVGPGLDTGIFSTTEREDGSLQLVAGKFPLYTFGGDSVPGDTNGQGSGDVWFAVGLDGKLLSGEAAADGDAAAATETTEAPETTVAAPPAPVTTASTDLGDVLVDADGITLYGFTKDADAVPSCNGDCAKAWPPLTIDGTELPAGLDPAVFSVAERADGSHQLVAGKWPLYRFAGDAAPGETNGQGSGGSWFVLDAAGGLIKNAG